MAKLRSSQNGKLYDVPVVNDHYVIDAPELLKMLVSAGVLHVAQPRRESHNGQIVEIFEEVSN